MAREWRVGQGWDIHRLVPGRKLVLGGIEISHNKGLSGHSDADVLAHAIIDALLGATADGDIGTHYPDNDPAWKDASSIAMLRSVAERLRSRGWSVVNIDTTVIAESPRLGPYRDQIRESISAAIGINLRAVSLKAKTAEKLGAEGRGEAISAQAVAMVARDEERGTP